MHARGIHDFRLGMLLSIRWFNTKQCCDRDFRLEISIVVGLSENASSPNSVK
jgi:hypothetical protein